jgi:YVTN family beta-propeller protein
MQAMINAARADDELGFGQKIPDDRAEAPTWQESGLRQTVRLWQSHGPSSGRLASTLVSCHDCFMKLFLSVRALLAGSMILGSASLAHAEAHYQFRKEIPVGGEGGWDYVSVEAAAHRLYVSHATKVIVIDTTRDAVVREIDGLVGVHGFAKSPALGRGYASNGRDNTVSIVDLSTLKTLAKVATGQNPDTILFEPTQAEVYAFNGRGRSVTVITASTGVVVATLPLGGKPEFAQTDGARIFINLEDKNEVAVIDVKTRAVAAHWPIAPGEEASGMGLDREHHRLFLGCGNAKLMVLDSEDGHVVASLPAGKGIDGAAFDAGTQLAFTSNGADGTVTVVHEDTPDKFTIVQTLTTETGARTMAVDPVSHKIYLPSAKFEAKKPGDSKRPKMIPGTFKVLVYELKA